MGDYGATRGQPLDYAAASAMIQHSAKGATADTAHFCATTRGTYYLCQVPGHAQEGMYGKIIIEYAAHDHRPG